MTQAEISEGKRIHFAIPRIEVNLNPDVVAGTIGGLIMLGIFSPLAYLALNNLLTFAKAFLNE